MSENTSTNENSHSSNGIVADHSGASANSTLSQLFVQGGESIKFFIQRDTGKQFTSWLANTITKHGGIVVQVVPLSGYVLIDPSTDSGTRLVQKWKMPETRPSRHIICYTFVRASIVAGKLVSPEKMEGITAFFRDMNTPVEFYLHPALNKELSKKAAVEIELCGGVTGTTEENARVIIAPHKTKKEIMLWNDLVRKYDADESKYIEDLDWVDRCIETQTFEKTVHRKKNMGGRKPGAKRVEYTEEDDQNLIKYIAEKIPYLEAGGRLGNNLYLELEKDKSLYPWAQRHSWHSWRNRYKMRQLIFDVAIREYVNQNPPTADGTRPAHPALITLDNACDRDEDDQARGSGNSTRAGGGDRNSNAKGKTVRQKKKRARSPYPSSSDSGADDVGGRLWPDEDSDENDGEDGEGARALGGRQPDKRSAPKRRRTRVASSIDEDEDGDG